MVKPRYEETCEYANAKAIERQLTREEVSRIVNRIIEVLASEGLTYGQSYDILREVRTALQIQAEFVKLP